MEQIIFLVAIAVISLLHSWWKKRNGEVEGEEAPPASWPGQPARPPAGTPPPAQRPAAGNWEDELRRLLQGDESEPVRRPPPVVEQPSPPLLPQPAARRPRIAPRPVAVAELDGDSDVGLPVRMPSLEQSAQAFLRASQLEQRVADHMRGVDAQVTAHVATVQRKASSPAVHQAVALVRDRQSQRAALMAGIILGPPKALENWQGPMTKAQ